MTDIAKLKEAVIEAAKEVDALNAGNGTLEPLAFCLALGAQSRAVSALRTAEEAEKRPRLRTLGMFLEQVPPIGDSGKPYCLRALEARDAEWMAAIRKLPRCRLNGVSVGEHRVTVDAPDLISVADIEALAESAK